MWAMQYLDGYIALRIFILEDRKKMVSDASKMKSAYFLYYDKAYKRLPS